MACGCGCSGLDQGAAALVASASSCGSRSSAMGAIGDAVLPTIVWPSDVDDYVAHLDPQWRSTDAAVQRCTKIDAATQAAWNAALADWNAWKKNASCVFGCANKYTQAQQYESELSAWQKKVTDAGCTLVAPAVVAQDTSALKWVAAAIIVAGVVYLAAPAVRAAFR